MSGLRIRNIAATLLVTLGVLTVQAGAAPITIVNGDFEAPLDPLGWHWVPDWDEGGASYYGSGAGGFLYCDAGGWVAQDLNYNWTAGEVFTLGITGNEGWRSGGSFKIQLREADTTLLWESATMPVTSTDSNFTWTIDSSTDFLGGTPGSQLNIRIECLAATVYLDDVTLSTDLADVIAPTLAGSDIVDDKSGGPVNPGELVTYTVTFSEAMSNSTVSVSDFDNAGTAAIAFGTITPAPGSGATRYSIPVVASTPGTLQLRVPIGATMTDLSSNALDTTSAILDDTTINVVAKEIGVTGGDFEDPYTNDQPGDIPLWFDNTVGYADWHNAARYTSSGSQCALLGNSQGYMYQSLGQLEAGTKSLDWSFDQVRYTLGSSTATADLRFFYGVSTSAGEGTDIDTLGLTQIGSTTNIPAVSGSDTNRTGSLKPSSVPAGSTIWVDFTLTGSGSYFLLDNITVTATAYAGMVLIIR